MYFLNVYFKVDMCIIAGRAGVHDFITDIIDNISISVYIMCVILCLFYAWVGILQIPIIIIIKDIFVYMLLKTTTIHFSAAHACTPAQISMHAHMHASTRALTPSL